MARRLLVMIATMALLLGAAKVARADSLKIGTLAPADSPWGQVFKVWARNVDQRSNSALSLDWQWGGTAGDENTMVASMKSNQLDGAAITAVGLGLMYQDVLVFQLPGAFSSWDQLSHARDAAKPALEAGFEASGFHILGWGDVGAAKIMSTKNYPVKVPNDLKGKNLSYISGDQIGPVFLQKIGGISPTPVTVPEIYGKLTTGAIDVINAPPLAAQQLQWAGSVTNINTYTTGYGIGALVIAKSRFDSLPADVQTVLSDTGGESARRLTNRIRAIDSAAFAQMKNNKTAYEPTDAEKALWNSVFQQTRAALKGNPFSASIYATAGIN